LAFTEQDQVTCVTFSPDGTRLATAGPAGINVYADNGKLLVTPPGIKEISRVSFSPDGKRLASAGWDKIARVFDAADGKELLAFTGHGNAIHGIAFSPDGKRLVTGSEDRTVRIWDLPTSDKGSP
jgi:WD40 repeat protein